MGAAERPTIGGSEPCRHAHAQSSASRPISLPASWPARRSPNRAWLPPLPHWPPRATQDGAAWATLRWRCYKEATEGGQPKTKSGKVVGLVVGVQTHADIGEGREVEQVDASSGRATRG